MSIIMMTPPLDRRRIPLWQLTCVLSMLGVCILIFFPLYQTTENGAWLALIGIPVAIAAQFWGLWRGLLVAGICSIVSSLLYASVDAWEWWTIIQTFLMSNAMLLPIAATIGRFHDIGAQLQQEIEERIRSEQALRISERRYRALFDHMSSGVDRV